MFKVSDDLDSDDDFLQKEFTDDFLSSPPSFTGRCSTEPAGRLSKEYSSNVITKSCIVGGKSTTREFQPKAKTSPNLLNVTSSAQLRRPLDVAPDTTNRHASPGKDDGVRNINGIVNSVVTHSKPPVSSRKDDVENRHSAFLAEWNDSFFNAPEGKRQPPSPAVHKHTPTIVTRKMNRTVRQRRFPGPAGLLPPRQGNTSLIAPEEFLNELKGEENDPSYQESEILSQSSGSVFEGGAWSAMLEDLGASGQSLLKTMNLESIKGIGRNLRSYKVPFLSVLIQSVDSSLPDAAVVFKDPTGEMHGVIHRDVWDQFSSDIAVGTVLVLRNVGIISAGVSSRKHVVNITGNNLTAIYSPKDELNIQLRRIHEFAASASSKLLAEWEKVEAQINSSSPRIPLQTPLFNSFHNGGLNSKNVAVIGRAPGANQHPYGKTFTSMTPSLNQRNGPVAPNSNPNYRPINRAEKPNYIDPSTSSSTLSPFSPMLSRPSSSAPNQKSPVTANKVPTSTGNQKFIPKSPFTMKTSTNSRPQQPMSEIPNLSCRPPTSTLTVKKPKLCQIPPTTNSETKTNPFQIDAETSAVDSLLEGIDADSLFGEF